MQEKVRKILKISAIIAGAVFGAGLLLLLFAFISRPISQSINNDLFEKSMSFDLSDSLGLTSYSSPASVESAGRTSDGYSPSAQKTAYDSGQTQNLQDNKKIIKNGSLNIYVKDAEESAARGGEPVSVD